MYLALELVADLGDQLVVVEALGEAVGELHAVLEGGLDVPDIELSEGLVPPFGLALLESGYFLPEVARLLKVVLHGVELVVLGVVAIKFVLLVEDGVELGLHLIDHEEVVIDLVDVVLISVVHAEGGHLVDLVVGLDAGPELGPLLLQVVLKLLLVHVVVLLLGQEDVVELVRPLEELLDVLEDVLADGAVQFVQELQLRVALARGRLELQSLGQQVVDVLHHLLHLLRGVQVLFQLVLHLIVLLEHPSQLVP